MYDSIIVGAGFCGGVIARKLAECGKKVLILERRNHIAGNMYDVVNSENILVQKYGPHIFHTNNKQVVDFIQKYDFWQDYYLECMVYMNGKYTPSPFNFKTIDDYYSVEKATQIKNAIKENYPNQEKATIVELLQCGDTLIKEYADFLFDNDYSLYTAKQWGIKPSQIDVSVLKRVPVLFSYKTGYFDDKYQIMPQNGFSSFFEKLLNHKNITIRLNIEAKEFIKIDVDKQKVYFNSEETKIPIIYTGALDDILDYRYGVLPYRSLRFEYITENKHSYQEAPVVAYPQEKDFTRITEFNKLPMQNKSGKTTVAKEYPLLFDENSVGKIEPYYPIVNDENREKHNRYLEDIQNISNLYLCGRLADYKYYNMDNAIERAWQVFNDIKL